MWFADVGLVVSGAALTGWVLLLVVSLTLPRFGIAVPVVVRAPLRGPALIGTGVAVGLFAAQAGVVDTVADTAGTGLLDRWVLVWFVAHRGAAATAAMAGVSAVGGTAGMAVLAALAAALLWRARRRAEAGVVLAAAVGAGLLVTGFKHLYGRARPPVADRLSAVTSAALPSGHALGSMVVLGVLAAVIVLAVRRPAVQALAAALAVAGIVTIGVSRLYLGVHWMTDVLTGWLLGGAWLALCVSALVLLQHRRHPGPDPAPTQPGGDSDDSAAAATGR